MSYTNKSGIFTSMPFCEFYSTFNGIYHIYIFGIESCKVIFGFKYTYNL